MYVFIYALHVHSIFLILQEQIGSKIDIFFSDNKHLPYTRTYCLLKMRYWIWEAVIMINPKFVNLHMAKEILGF